MEYDSFINYWYDRTYFEWRNIQDGWQVINFKHLNFEVMTEYELEQYCNAHPNCDCKCMKCEAFTKHIRTELGYNDK